jgi:zinc transport system substrate-binding protein
MKVAVTIFPLYDLARRIAGPEADVVLVVPVGASEVDFTPSRREAEAVKGAKLGILVGLGLDDWMQGVLDDAAPKARRLVAGARVPTLAYRPDPIVAALTRRGLSVAGPGLEGKPDPHVWLDPARALLMAKAIAEEMARADPSRAAGYRQRSAELMQDLEGLDRDVESRVASWHVRSFVSLRPDFAYFAERYGLEIPVTLEPSSGVVPPQLYQEEVIEAIRLQRLGGVFGEPQFALEPAVTAGRAAGVPVGLLDPLGGGEERATYDDLIRFDTNALEKVLSGPAPATAESRDGGV